MEERMDRETFNNLLNELDGNSLHTLTNKNGSYSSDEDVLHNFRSGAKYYQLYSFAVVYR